MLSTEGNDPSRAVLEAIALEGYRTDRLLEYQVQQLLGFETRLRVHGFLKENGVFLHYSLEDLEHDIEEVRRCRALRDANHPSELCAG